LPGEAFDLARQIHQFNFNGSIRHGWRSFSSPRLQRLRSRHRFPLTASHFRHRAETAFLIRRSRTASSRRMRSREVRFMQQVGLATWSLPTAAIDCSSAAEDFPQQRALIEQQ
jgi:hypothetical protein